MEMEYKATKVKGAVRLYCNGDAAIQMMLEFEERAEEMGRRSVVKEACSRRSLVSSFISNIPLKSRRNCGSVE